ncbi:MAG: HAD-IIA family hydrolase [Clostridia bacterium]|nr:HAD-IIA family hydrolase [Clostridia bacterium]
MREKGNSAELRDVRLFLFDLDGTLYLGEQLYPYTKALLEEIKRQGKHYLFMTNNSSRGVDAYVEKMKRLGIKATADDFITSVMATSAYILKTYPEKLFYVAGTESFKQELRASGVRVTDLYSGDVEGVIQGFDTELTFQKLDDVSKLLTLKEIPFIAANPDFVCPTEYGFVPDCGSICGMLEKATGKKPYYIGKPRPEMVYFAVERIRAKDSKVSLQNTLVVGDRMYTDIACGISAGAKTCLVLSGETTEEQAYASDYKIDYILKDCERILEAIR